jgi:hypothetical protein
MSNGVIKFTNMDGSPLKNNKVGFVARAGYEAVREIMVTNTHVWPIQLVKIAKQQDNNQNFSVLSFPTETLWPGQSGKVQIQYRAPADEVNLEIGMHLFDVDISKFG